MKQEDQIQGFQAPIIYQPQEEKVTIASVFKKKFFVWLENSPVIKIFFAVVELGAVALLAAALILPSETASFIGAVLSWYGYAVPKTIFAFFVVKYRNEIRSFFKKFKRSHNQHTIEGIPTSELLHFLFETNGFKLADFKKKFGLNQRIHDKIAKQLERLGILVRGENNARVLSAKFSLQEVREVLENSRSNKAKDISFFRVVKNGIKETLTKKEIEDELEEYIEEDNEMMEEVEKEIEEKRSVGPGFTVRKIGA